MERILISACLMGRPVRYNGSDKRHNAAEIIARWRDEGRLVLLCPEVAAGLPTPRPPAEIRGAAATGATVIAGHARVIDDTGADVTAAFLNGAHQAVALATQHGCRHAVLTDGSPSCGSTFIYDGSFTGVRKPGTGTATAALQQAGVQVWPETSIAELDAMLRG